MSTNPIHGDAYGARCKEAAGPFPPRTRLHAPAQTLMLELAVHAEPAQANLKRREDKIAGYRRLMSSADSGPS
eukprot:47291-Eustigmatos_ZCMA.PRE.1